MSECKKGKLNILKQQESTMYWKEEKKRHSYVKHVQMSKNSNMIDKKAIEFIPAITVKYTYFCK